MAMNCTRPASSSAPSTQEALCGSVFTSSTEQSGKNSAHSWLAQHLATRMKQETQLIQALTGEVD
jgi:hypothetical protein